MADNEPSLWDSVGDAVTGLERAWQTTGRADLGLLVPPLAHPLHTAALVTLIKIDQEYRFRSGQPKRLEEYVSEWPELKDRPEALGELLEGECLTRAIFGVLPTPEELRQRFPTLAWRVDLAAVAAEAAREPGAGESSSDSNAKAPDPTPPHARAVPPMETGHGFGRYEIRSLLGGGGMGTVYRAYDTQLPREVALKVPSFTFASEQVRRRFVREAEAAAKIRHPNVCPVFDAGEIEGVCYMTMALIEGESLAERLKAGTMEPRQAAELVRKLAQALAAVHGGGILHRDIKPSNVMIESSGEPVLMDFGLACHAEAAARLSGDGELAGTLPFVAPERIDGKPADARSDVYSLSVVLYELLTGTLPFPPGDSVTQLLDSIAKADPPKPRTLRADLDAVLESICLRGLAKDPADRYQSAADMAEALRRYLEGERQLAGPPPRRRWRTWIATAVAAAAMLLAGTVIYVRTNRGTTESPVVWHTNLDIDQGCNLLVRTKLTPDRKHLIVFHNSGADNSSVARVEKLDARTGDVVWRKSVELSHRVSCNGWVDGAGSIFFGSSHDGATVWKYDESLGRLVFSYCEEKGGLEYVNDVLTDVNNQVFIAGFDGSRAGGGSRCTKLTKDGRFVWSGLCKHTDGKDAYERQLALDSGGNLYRVGADFPPEGFLSARGRVIGNSGADGSVILDIEVAEPNSCVGGVLTDPDDNLYVAYTYDLYSEPDGHPSGKGRTVVQKLDPQHEVVRQQKVVRQRKVVWEYRFPELGTRVGRDCLVQGPDGVFYLAYQATVGGASYPAIAKFTRNGRMTDKINIDRPGWDITECGVDADNDTVYVGLVNWSDMRRVQVLALRLADPSP